MRKKLIFSLEVQLFGGGLEGVLNRVLRLKDLRNQRMVALELPGKQFEPALKPDLPDFGPKPLIEGKL